MRQRWQPLHVERMATHGREPRRLKKEAERSQNRAGTASARSWFPENEEEIAGAVGVADGTGRRCE